MLQNARASVSFRDSDRNATPLAVVEPNGPRLGPWMIIALDPNQSCLAGTLVLRIEADEQARYWTIEADFPIDRIRTGRFAPMVRHDGRRLCWAPEWSEILDTHAGA